MTMAVMHIGHVRVRMPYRLMLVKMRVRLPWRIEWAVSVLVVLVVKVRMGVRHGFVRMLMFMTLREMQPDPERHQGACH